MNLLSNVAWVVVGMAVGSVLTSFLFMYLEAKEAKRMEQLKLREEQREMWNEFMNKLGGQNG